jgi:hypothetical protein
VIVTRVAKRSFLEASRAIGQLEREPRPDALETEGKKVEAAWAEHLAAHQ